MDKEEKKNRKLKDISPPTPNDTGENYILFVIFFIFLLHRPNQPHKTTFVLCEVNQEHTLILNTLTTFPVLFQVLPTLLNHHQIQN